MYRDGVGKSMLASEDLYVLTSDGGEDDSDEWVSPRPISEAVRAAVSDVTDLDAGDVDEVSAYVDRDELAAVLGDEDSAESLTFGVEGNAVTVTDGGHVSVDPSK